MSMRERSRPLSESRMQGVGVRCYQPSDQEAVLPLAARLTVGIAPWLDPARFEAFARERVAGSIARIGPEQAVFVAEDEQGQIVGFISVGRLTHFSGEPRAYIGELVVAEAAEGRGVGRRLVAAAESWARDHGYHLIALDTGAANARARDFYGHLGYQEEQVTLVKLL